MADRLIALVAFAVLIAFLGILIWKVPRLDLGVVIFLTLLLGGYDLIRKHDSSRNG